jgi:hypothetical protein
MTLPNLTQRALTAAGSPHTLAIQYFAFYILHVKMPALGRAALVAVAGAFSAYMYVYKTSTTTSPSNAPTSNGATATPGTFTRRIVAVGDLHGDLGNAHKVLEMSGVVDEDRNWTGNVDFFVQTGDIVDRCVATLFYGEWHANMCHSQRR